MVTVYSAVLTENLLAPSQSPPSCSCSLKQFVFISLLLVCFQTDSACQGCFHQEPWKSNTLVIKSHHSRASPGQCIWRIDQLISSATFIYFKLNTCGLPQAPSLIFQPDTRASPPHMSLITCFLVSSVAFKCHCFIF